MNVAAGWELELACLANHPMPKSFFIGICNHVKSLHNSANPSLTYLSGFLTLNVAFRDFSLESTWQNTEFDLCSHGKL